jgi:hypothetical protein
MGLLPSLLIVFDTTALLSGQTRDWLEFSQLGECYLPEAILEEMQSLNDHASDPAIEKVAREFNRFYPTSGWKRTGIRAEHPSLTPAEGHTLSKRSRLALEVLQCAYGMARRHPSCLVVLVANDQPMLQRLLALNTANLCGLPLAAFLLWSRTQRRPAAITHHLQRMRSPTAIAGDEVPARKVGPPPPSPWPPEPEVPASRPTSYQATRQRRNLRSAQISRLLSSVVTWLVVAIAIAVVWRVVHPSSFQQFWRQLPIVGKQR